MYLVERISYAQVDSKFVCMVYLLFGPGGSVQVDSGYWRESANGVLGSIHTKF